MMTLAGGKAAGIARWAWSDPAARVQKAIEQVNELATQTTDPDELAEIGDTATMLSRLAGTLHPPEPETIGAQLAVEGTMYAQLIELGRSPAWMHERRGPHGEWERGAGGSPGAPRAPRMQSERARKLASARQQRLIAAEVKRQAARPPATMSSLAPASGGNKAAGVAAAARSSLGDISPEEAARQLKAIPLLPGEDPATHMNPLPGESPRENLLHEQLFHQRVAPLTEAKAAETLDAAKQHVAQKLVEAKAIADSEEDAKSKHDALLKAATESGIAVGGAILAYVETRLGVPDLLAIASSAGAILVQIIIEWYKRLLCRHLHRKTGRPLSTYSRRRSWTTGWMTTSWPRTWLRSS